MGGIGGFRESRTTRFFGATTVAAPFSPSTAPSAASAYYDPTISVDDDVSAVQSQPAVSKEPISLDKSALRLGQFATAPRAFAKRFRMSDAGGPAASQESNLDANGAPRLQEMNEHKMHELIFLQTFDGSWKWTEEIFVLLGLEKELVRAVLAGFEEDVMTTLLAVAFLEGKTSTEEGVWEMVVEKAKRWLEANVGQNKYVEGLANVQKDVIGID